MQLDVTSKALALCSLLVPRRSFCVLSLSGRQESWKLCWTHIELRCGLTRFDWWATLPELSDMLLPLPSFWLLIRHAKVNLQLLLPVQVSDRVMVCLTGGRKKTCFLACEQTRDTTQGCVLSHDDCRIQRSCTAFSPTNQSQLNSFIRTDSGLPPLVPTMYTPCTFQPQWQYFLPWN